jgi:uncharacterized membrane protein YphA (DoxX/SURF4 family)
MFIDRITYFAHEVYVLTPLQIEQDQNLSSPNVWQALSSGSNLWTLIIGVVVALVVLSLMLWLKSTKPFGKLGKFIDKATYFAPDLIRVAFGMSLLLSASHHSLFGPELPLSSFPLQGFSSSILIILGVSLTVGIFSKLMSIAAIVLFCLAFTFEGWYMLTYINYLGEAIAVLLLPIQNLSLDRLIARFRHSKVSKSQFQDYSLPVARILFGLSIIYAAVNVKFVTSSLSVDVVNRYHLTNYFHFDPLMIVLGAGLVEVLIGLLYVFGLLQRFNTVFFLVFLTLSLLFFKEDIWPHYLLIALALGIFLHKPDRLTLDSKLSGPKK